MRLIPRDLGPKRLLMAGVIILAGCGGSAGTDASPQRIAGKGFVFDAPAGWQLERGHRLVVASKGRDLVQVSTFPLQKPYADALFGKVARELQTRVEQVAAQSGGKLTGRSVVTVASSRAHSYVVATGDRIDEYTFVLRGKREYLLVCRRTRAHESAACDQLIRSFALTASP